MDTLQTLIDKYTGIYTKTKRKIEKKIKVTCTEEDRYNRIIHTATMIACLAIMPLIPLKTLLFVFTTPFIIAEIYQVTRTLFMGPTSPEEEQELQKKLESLVSPDDINAVLNGLAQKAVDSCVVTKIPVCYKVSKKVYMSIEPVTIGNTPLKGFKAGEIRFTGVDLPPVLLSLRGQKGPRTKKELMQKCILGEGSEKFGKAKNAVYPCISEAVFDAFPDEIRMEAVCVDLFPDIMQGEWKFLVHNPEAYGEIETAVKMLCGAVLESITRNKLETMLQKAAKNGEALHRPLELVTREDLIDCFSRKSDAEETQLSDAFTTTEAALIPTVDRFDISTPFIMSESAAIEDKNDELMNDELIIDVPSA